MKKHKRLGDMFYLGILATIIIWLLFEAMQYFGYFWFGEKTAGIVWLCIMGVLFLLS